MDIRLTLEVTGDENILDADAHQRMLDCGTKIRKILRKAGVQDEAVSVTFFGDNMLETF